MVQKFFKIFFAAAIAGSFFAACSKDDSNNSTPTTSNFNPLTANSTWTYQNTPGGSFTLTATSKDTVANGRTYRVLSNSDGPNTYSAKDGDNYYRYGSIAQLNIAAVEELYLKADQGINATWSASQTFTLPGVPIPLTTNLNYSIKEKGITKTTAGKAYSNVTHVRLDLSLVGLGAIGGGDFYYADGIGMIENAINVTVPGQAAVNQTQTLTASTIR